MLRKVFVILFSVLLSSLSIGSAEIEQYRRRTHDMLKSPADARDKMVLEVEKDRKLTSEGNIIHVEPSHDYLNKELDLIRIHIKDMEATIAKLDERLRQLELKIKRSYGAGKEKKAK